LTTTQVSTTAAVTKSKVATAVSKAFLSFLKPILLKKHLIACSISRIIPISGIYQKCDDTRSIGIALLLLLNISNNFRNFFFFKFSIY
jgi:hypothetical protein